MHLEPFCKLADASKYIACDLDLSQDIEGRDYWIALFKRHIDMALRIGIEADAADGRSAEDAEARAQRCRRDLFAALDAFSAEPTKFGRVTILTIDEWRDRALRAQGFGDAFRHLKDRENAKMLPLLPAVCRELDALEGREQLEAVVRGVFAGNIFDMGSEATAKAFLGESPDFFTTRNNIPPRPWLIDQFDTLAERLHDGPRHHKAVFFVDNAGSDFLLGAVPMMRWLARRGTRVVLAANERPTLNDMTCADVLAWWLRIVEAEPSLAGLPIEPVSTGTGEPLIDLARVSPELNMAARDVDLVVLEGMGRGVESNIHAMFSCDALNIAMIKDRHVAQRHGGKVFDVVCRFYGCGRDPAH